MENYKAKGFFEKPEGKTGMVFIVVGVFAFLLIGNYILPFIIVALQNTIHAAILGGIVLGTIFLIMNEKFRILCSNLFKSAMRLITSCIVTIDPIGILKNHISYMEDKIEDMEKNITLLLGKKQKLEYTIQEQKNQAQKSAEMAMAAKKHQDQDTFTIESRDVVRIKESVAKMEVTLKRMEMIYIFISKMKKNVSLLLKDTKNEVKTREIEYVSIKEAAKAMNTVKRLVQGDAQKELFDQAMEFIADDISNKIAEMDRAMEATKEFMDKADLQNTIWDEKGLKIIEMLENGGELFNYDTTKSSEPGLSANFAPPSGNSPSQFSQFFKQGVK